MRILASLIILSFITTGLSAQCASWVDSPRQDDAENAHVIYRQSMKAKDYQGAFEQWELAFELAPTADGRRHDHFKDGITIYRDMLTNESNEDKKKEYKAKIMELYETGAECIASGAITYKNCTDQECIDQRVGQFKGRQAVDMYYYVQTPRLESFEVFKEAILLAGNSSEYTILKPCTDITVYLYLNDMIDDDVARRYISKLNEIAEYNIENNEKYARYYEYEMGLMRPEIAKIEKMIYDCNYFVEKMKPRYDGDPLNPENLKTIIATLKKQGCIAGEPFLDKVEAEYGVIAAAYNAEKQAEFEANNPAYVAKKCYDDGDWDCAISKYNEAIEAEEDDAQKAAYYIYIATIQYREKKTYSAARATALKAAKLKTDWGRPYMLIADMYAKASNSCGNDAYTRGLAVLAAIDKWSYAKSVDPSFANEANGFIAKYRAYIPPKDDAFMMGKKEGQTDKVGCWIGENVKLRLK